MEAFQNDNYVTSQTSSSMLLKHPVIADEIKRRLADVVKQYAPDKANVLKELASLAFSNVRNVFDKAGNLLPIHEMPAHVTAAMKKVKSKEITATNLATGEEKIIGYLREVEMADKLMPLKLLGVEEGMFTEKVELQAGKGFAEILREGRERVAARNRQE
jgi:hypothetical protein